MKQADYKKQSKIPLILMGAFSLLLFFALLFRIHYADRDLAKKRLQNKQAKLAAESAIDYAMIKIRDKLLKSSSTQYLQESILLAMSNFDQLDQWVSFGNSRAAKFKIVSIQPNSSGISQELSMLDKNLQFEIIAQGRSGSSLYSAWALVQLYDIVESFGAFGSLDEFYYGIPLQPSVSKFKDFEAFKKQNANFFNSGKVDRNGVIHDPQLLLQTYSLNEKDQFSSGIDSNLTDNYGTLYFDVPAQSPLNGPLYSNLPIITDSHTFRGPLQTALYFYRRPYSQVNIDNNSSFISINSSLRIQQHANNSLEGKNWPELVIDRDTFIYPSYLPPWNPDFDYLRQLSKIDGIYIDKEGIGYYKGKPNQVNYHFSSYKALSDSYMEPLAQNWKQDEILINRVVLANYFEETNKNNLNVDRIYEARVIFSENSIFIRGDIETDLVIVTPQKIFITGSLNTNNPHNLMLLAEDGIAISTSELEKHIVIDDVPDAMVDKAITWQLNAVLYNPGAGIFSSNFEKQDKHPISAKKFFNGKSLVLQIFGATIGGNLQRWIKNSHPQSFSIEHRPKAIRKLPFRPFSINRLVLKTEKL